MNLSKNSPVSTLGMALVLTGVLVFERAAGLPLIATLLFFYLTLSRNVLFQVVAISLYALMTSSLFMVHPGLMAIIISSACAILSARKKSTLQARSWEYVYMALICAAMVSYLAGVVWQLSVVVSIAVQMTLILVVVRRIVFKGMTQSYHWEREMIDTAIHEKRI